MSERLIKPYEISVWEDKLTQNGFIENKLAVIGADTMTGLNKVYDPVFNKKSNGEKTLSFSLKYKYFDPYSGNSDYINPFAALLTNERKVKLHYDNKWYEFIVKDHTESSDESTWTYTCTDAFVLELSKNGYNITFDSELNNNQGTAKDLAAETLKNTDWQLKDANIGRQLVAEPVYQATLLSTEGIEIINTDGTEETVSDNTSIYLFYSYIKNHNGKYIQFIIRDDSRQYTIDDNNVITDTNFRIKDELIYKEDGFYKGSSKIISWEEIEIRYQVNRLVYNQLTTYDPVMQRTVDRFKVNDREIYRYTDYTYTTSNVITNFITNGENFNVLEDGSLQGWNEYVDFTKESESDKIDRLALVTYPELGTGKGLADISKLSQIEGYLKAQFKGALTQDYKNAIFNSGIENNASAIESISLGQKFVFRWRAGHGQLGSLEPEQNLRLLIAKYTRDDPVRYGYYYRHIDPNNIILDFEGTPTILNNIVQGGSLVEETERDEETGIETGTGVYDYIIDNVVQTPSTKYIYINSLDEEEYIWNGIAGQFELKTDSNYLPYYYLTAEARQAVPSSDLTDPTQKFGIFIYTIDGTSPIYIQDIQLTYFVPDGADATGQTPILMGNVPTATSNPTDYYYLKPSDGAAAEDVQTYTSLNDLASELEVTINDIIPIYNEDSEKVLSITASQSNCFNILQTIAETFECWVDLVVDHDNSGYITYTDDKPNKFVYLKEYAGKDNYAGFKYGINLQSIERTVNSDEVVTKLIVDESQSDYVDEGYVSIANAPSNQSGESYIINFEYYYNQGLLDRETVEADRLEFVTAVAQVNADLQDKEKQRRDLEASLTALGSKRNVLTELVETARDTQTRALGEFESLTGKPYEDYKEEHPTLEEDDQLTEEDTILEILGDIYVSSATINNYAGTLTNIEQEYWKIRKELKGSENYNIKIWVDTDSNEIRHLFVELNDYLPGFSFTISNSGTEYTSTVSKKYFDIEIYDSNAIIITFNTPDGFTINPTEYIVNENKVEKFKIVSDESIDGIEDKIEEIREQKEKLTNDFNNKYRRFIQEGTWNSTDYIDSELYYLDALQVSNTSAQPTVSYTINVVEISELEGFEWYLFDAGDKTYVEDTEFFGWANINGHLTPAREEVIVSEVEWHLDEPDQNIITVQNYKTRFEDLFQRISAAVQTVQYNEATYAKISSLLDANGSINQDVLLESLNRISGQNYNLTSDGSVLINGDQILVQNLINPANRVIINSEGIRISSDGGQTWRTAIDGQGINIGTVYTGTLNTQNIIIGSSDNPSFRWDKAGISAYKLNSETGVYDLKTYVRYDEYGLYGIKDNTTFKAQSLEDVLDKAHFAVTWDGFFIKNSYPGGGRVEITSDNDFRVMNIPEGQISEQEKIKIGALEWGEGIISPDAPGATAAPTLYGIRINNNTGQTVMKTGDDGNLEITGTIYANAGEIGGMSVDNDRLRMDHIVFEPGVGIYSDWGNTSTYPFIISDVDGSATFNSVIVRGSIKTSVFEYEEIQAVGGAFIFRPSTAIKTAVADNGDLVLTVEKPLILRDGAWYKLSNYNSDDTIDADELTTYGLTHIYQLSKTKVGDETEIRLIGGAAILQTINIDDIPGGSIIDMGFEPNTYRPIKLIAESSPVALHLYELVNGEYILTNDITVVSDKTYYKEWYQEGINNYGIGINSSDNYINLPPRAISLFETIVDHTQDPKVSYKYRGILGTLPQMRYSGNNPQVSELYHNYLEGTQGIYTDNMYLGDKEQYIAFYEDNQGKKQLKIKANQVVYEIVDEDTGESEWKDISETAQGADGEDAITVTIDSSAGTVFLNKQITTTLTCTVIKGNGTDITNQVTRFTWSKKNADGTVDTSWSRPLAGNTITISEADVTSKAIFTCEVEF